MIAAPHLTSMTHVLASFMETDPVLLRLATVSTR